MLHAGDFGGMFGLLLGGSVLSMVEILDLLVYNMFVKLTVMRRVRPRQTERAETTLNTVFVSPAANSNTAVWLLVWLSLEFRDRQYMPIGLYWNFSLTAVNVFELLLAVLVTVWMQIYCCNFQCVWQTARLLYLLYSQVCYSAMLLYVLRTQLNIVIRDKAKYLSQGSETRVDTQKCKLPPGFLSIQKWWNVTINYD